MKVEDVLPVVEKIKGCTFATIDAETYPKHGIRHTVEGERVILFGMKSGSGYENMVKRRLAEIGKNPDDFVLDDLKWGTRVHETPLIVHKGIYYLQTVVLHHGVSKFYIGRHEIDPASVGLSLQKNNQGLPLDEQVNVRTYKLESLTRLTLMKEEIKGEGPKRPILSLKTG